MVMRPVDAPTSDILADLTGPSTYRATKMTWHDVRPSEASTSRQPAKQRGRPDGPGTEQQMSTGAEGMTEEKGMDRINGHASSSGAS
jgi:hypothetical protein